MADYRCTGCSWTKLGVSHDRFWRYCPACGAGVRVECDPTDIEPENTLSGSV